ncbi:hypothetical protein EI42_04957 [Thermosporothrix hazakensis]|jgi:hypothetical protein|uniref:Uncharacterized protein n=1 Tax=Thermosporothrix hazakensis TaxID=644383 RepID=A0A326U1B5_THEHA|nr:hypothetical protein EI42_04957 [Thermosporothrix hazakensis]
MQIHAPNLTDGFIELPGCLANTRPLVLLGSHSNLHAPDPHRTTVGRIFEHELTKNSSLFHPTTLLQAEKKNAHPPLRSGEFYYGRVNFPTTVGCIFTLKCTTGACIFSTRQAHFSRVRYFQRVAEVQCKTGTRFQGGGVPQQQYLDHSITICCT